MTDERKRILQLLQDGKISVDQADLLMAEVDRRTDRGRLFRGATNGLGGMDRRRLEDLKQIGSQVSAAVSQSLGEVRRQVEQQLENWNIGPNTLTLSASTEVTLPETVSSIAVETRAGNIQVTSWDQPDIRLHIRGQVRSDNLADAKRTLEGALQADRTDDSYQLTITHGKDAVIGANIDIYVPHKFARLLCKTHSGSIHADSLEAADLQLDTVTGDVWIHDADVERLRANADTGSIELQRSVSPNCRSVYAATKNGRIVLDGIAAGLHCIGTAKTVNGRILVTGEDLVSEFEDSVRPTHARFEHSMHELAADQEDVVGSGREAHIYCENRNGNIHVRS